MQTPHSSGTVLITGASSGIGREFTTLFAKDNYDLVLVARSKENLTSLANELQATNEVFIKVIAKDLSIPSSAKEIVKELTDESIHIDILINNAGFATSGKFEEIPYEEDFSQIQLNVTTLTLLTKLLLPPMIKQKEGKILNVSSTAAFFPGPFMSVYYATKSYVFSFSQALREELKGTGVSVTTLCPGPTESKFAERAKVKDTVLFKRGTMKTEEVAKLGYEGLMRGEAIVIPGWRNKVEVFLTRVTPIKLLSKITRGVNTIRI